MRRAFSGIQPSGLIHLGNYLGAIKQWVKLQEDVDEAIFCVVDLHAITVPQDPLKLKKNILSTAAWYLAAGIDPKKSIVFVQSERPEHSELAWILNTIAKMGELSRMTQFKDKSSSIQAESVSVGLFDYPVLMAADILLYNASIVPVGEDQKQHVELSRDLAIRFNNRYGQTFAVPEPIIKKESARIMGLDDPTKKMSKSASSPYNYIAMTDDEETVKNKIRKAVTDSGNEIVASQDKPAITNLLNILAEVSGKSISQLQVELRDKSYGDLKELVASEITKYLKPIQAKYNSLMADESSLKKILENGASRAGALADQMLTEVKNKIGLGL